MKYKYHIYANTVPKGQPPGISELVEYETDEVLKPGDRTTLPAGDVLMVYKVYEVDQIPGTNEYIVLAGPSF